MSKIYTTMIVAGVIAALLVSAAVAVYALDEGGYLTKQDFSDKVSELTSGAKPLDITDPSVYIATSAIKIEDEPDKTNDSPLNNRDICFTGILDSVISSDTVVYLENPIDNGADIYMTFRITDRTTEQEIMSTDLVASGYAFPWNVGDVFTKGEYDVLVEEHPYWVNEEGNYVPLTGGINAVHFSVK